MNSLMFFLQSAQVTIVFFDARKQSKTPSIYETFSPSYKSWISEFGKWITSHQWKEVKGAVSTEEKTNASYNTILPKIGRHLTDNLTQTNQGSTPKSSI